MNSDDLGSDGGGDAARVDEALAYREAVDGLVAEVERLKAEGRFAEAVAAYDELLRRVDERPALDADDAAGWVKWEGWALIGKANVLSGSLGRSADALSLYDEVIVRLEQIEDPEADRLVASAHENKAAALDRLDRAEEMRSVQNDLLRRYGHEPPEGAMRYVASAMYWKAQALAVKDPATAIALYDELAERFVESDEQRVRDYAANALVSKGLLLAKQKRREDALATFDEVLRRFGAKEPDARLPAVANALACKGVQLARLGRLRAALDALDESTMRFGDLVDTGQPWAYVESAHASALWLRAWLLVCLGHPTQARAVLRELRSRFRDPSRAFTRKPLRRARALWLVLALVPHKRRAE